MPIHPPNDARQQAETILNRLSFMPFEQCSSLDRHFKHLPTRPGIYAIRHRAEGLLYLGKTNNLSTRFSGGHKAFTWAWLDLYAAEDVRIAVEVLDRWGNAKLLSELEAILLRAAEPPYNVKIPMES